MKLLENSKASRLLGTELKHHFPQPWTHFADQVHLLGIVEKVILGRPELLNLEDRVILAKLQALPVKDFQGLAKEIPANEEAEIL